MWSTTDRVPTGPTMVNGVGRERHHPAARDHVVEVGDVVAVQMRHEHRGEVLCAETDGREAHQHAATGVDEVVLVGRRRTGGDQRGRAGTVGAGQRAAGAEQGDGERHCRAISARAAASAASGAGGEISSMTTSCRTPSKANGAAYRGETAEPWSPPMLEPTDEIIRMNKRQLGPAADDVVDHQLDRAAAARAAAEPHRRARSRRWAP